MIQHIVNISGGKDSTAVYLLAQRRERPFRAVMAYVGKNEHDITKEYALSLSERTGGPAVEVIQADFTDRITARRAYVETAWRLEGVPEETIERALAVLRPTGDPFVDLTLWKGRFPSRRAQFCTEFLKAEPITQQVIYPALERGPVVQWLGVRRDESANRAKAPFTQLVRHSDRANMLLFRPIIHWTAENVFSFAKAHGLQPNPLYRMGAKRVGCSPCINSGKEDLISVDRSDPAAIERLLEWEHLCKLASKRGAATFFASDVTPEGAALGRSIKRRSREQVERDQPDLEPKARARAIKALAAEMSTAAPWPRADAVFEWARTSRGGRQFDMLRWADDRAEADEGISCTSQYGLCE